MKTGWAVLLPPLQQLLLAPLLLPLLRQSSCGVVPLVAAFVTAVAAAVVVPAASVVLGLPQRKTKYPPAVISPSCAPAAAGASGGSRTETALILTPRGSPDRTRSRRACHLLVHHKISSSNRFLIIFSVLGVSA
jgi:hypothetical protein